MTHDVAELRRQVRALGLRHRGARVPRVLRAALLLDRRRLVLLLRLGRLRLLLLLAGARLVAGARALVDLLLRRLAGEDTESLVLPPHLVVRQTA